MNIATYDVLEIQELVEIVSYARLKPLLWALGVIGIGILIWWLFFLRGYGEARIATGPDGGTYAVLGKGLAHATQRSESRILLQPQSTQGTAQNLGLLENNETDFAIVQSGVSHSPNVRVVAHLYQEVLHILLPAESDVKSLKDLHGRRIALGEPESGTREIGLAMLHHVGVTEFEDHLIPPGEAITALRDSKLDAVFLVTALHSPIIHDAIRTVPLRFLNLEFSVSGIRSRYPFLSEASIPAQAYECRDNAKGAFPETTIKTLGVPSLLVCRKDLSLGIVYEVTRELFANRSAFVNLTPEAFQISEITSSERFPWALHEGARRFYRRSEPGFLERYADVIALVMSTAAAAWALFRVASRWSSSRKKNRIDDYYLEVAAAFLRIEEDKLSDEVLEQEEKRLCRLRNNAFRDLANEQLKADESFRILQDQVVTCLDEVRSRKQFSMTS